MEIEGRSERRECRAGERLARVTASRSRLIARQPNRERCEVPGDQGKLRLHEESAALPKSDSTQSLLHSLRLAPAAQPVSIPSIPARQPIPSLLPSHLLQNEYSRSLFALFISLAPTAGTHFTRKDRIAVGCKRSFSNFYTTTGDTGVQHDTQQ